MTNFFTDQIFCRLFFTDKVKWYEIYLNEMQWQAWKFGGNDRFVTASFPSLIKDGNDNSFPQIHLHNTDATFEDLTSKHFYNLAYKLRFLHTDLPTLHKRACFSTTIPPLSIYLECSPTQCVKQRNGKMCRIFSTI